MKRAFCLKTHFFSVCGMYFRDSFYSQLIEMLSLHSTDGKVRDESHLDIPGYFFPGLLCSNTRANAFHSVGRFGMYDYLLGILRIHQRKLCALA